MMLPFPGTVLRREKRAGWNLFSLMLAETEHAVEGNSRMMASTFVNRDAVDNVALTQVFERPKEMLGSDAEHRGANANTGIERDDLVAFQFLAEAIDKVDFRANGPRCAGRRSLNGLDDGFG